MIFSNQIIAEERNCYSEHDLKKIAEAIIELRKCQISLAEKESLIQERLIRYEGSQGIAWWQEPTFVIGSISISFTVGSILGYMIAKK